MKRLAIPVLIYSLLSSSEAIFNASATGDKNFVLLGAAGLIFGLLLFFHKPVSAFLAIFIKIFAWETVVFGFVSLALSHQLLPKFPDEFLPPDTLPLTFSCFGIATFLLGHVPLIKRVLHIGDLFFNTQDRFDFKLWFYQNKNLREAAFATTMIVILVLINQGQVAISVRLSFVNRDLFNALQDKQQGAFWFQLLGVFMPFVFVYAFSALVEFVITSYFVLRWRRWLTLRYIKFWLNDGTHYRMMLEGGSTDNPDQRICEDVNQFINGGGAGNAVGLYGYSILFLSTFTGLTSYAIVLWGLSANFTVPGTNLIIPGFLFWIALLYAALGTFITHIIARKIAALSFARQRYEANFRFGLARLREYSEQVALLKGESNETARARHNFQNIFDNYLDLITINKRLIAFRSVFQYTSIYFPYIVSAPFYFSGKVSLGVLTQTANAFSSVQDSLTLFVSYYTNLAEFKAVLERLWSFEKSIAHATALKAHASIELREGHAGETSLHLSGLALKLPSGQNLITLEDLVMPKAEHVLLQGPSGIGKSTLFRAIAGIWPYGHGTVTTPKSASLMVLPQKPYIPLGNLRDALLYPNGDSHAPDDDALVAALEDCGLAHLTHRLDEDSNFSLSLSGGEQQRLALARALIAKPDFLLLDEATSALDEASEAALYTMLQRRMPATTLLSIGHRSSLIGLHKNLVRLVKDAGGAAHLETVAELAALP